ncbi:MAG: DUF721 domain-containing protein [Bdellovibrionaceae bacterium]|nr:DUF721 domain-containing protein [Pseudobdellovibrionaceae bacterium]
MDPKFPLKGSDAVLQGLFENGNSPLSAPFQRWKMWKRWPEFVGPTMAEVTEPVGLQKGTLYIWVKNSTWMQQVSFLKEQLRVSLNQKLGQKNTIRRIQLTLNRNLVPQDPEALAQLKETIQKLGADPDAPKADIPPEDFNPGGENR